MKRHSDVITLTWIALNLLPLILILLLSLFLQSWVWGFSLVALYILCFVPYGFFVSLPLMVKIFHKPSSIHGPAKR